jgi:hypothetical protein
MAEFDTNPGDRSVSDLEHEVDRERAELSATIDALRDKASVGNLVDQIVKVVTENGGEISRNLGRSIRDNPLPALLTGVGIAWLMAGGGPQPRYQGWRDDYTDDDPYARLADMDASGDGVAAIDEDEGGTGLGARAAETAAGLRDSAAGMAHGARHRMASAGEGLRGAGEAARHRMASAGEGLRGAGEAARHRMAAAGEGLRGAGDAARDRAGRLRSRAAHAGEDVRESFDYLVEEQPLVLGALALALGAAVGGALPSSRTEERLFGAQAERARQRFRELAEEEGEKAGATLGAMASEAQAVVDETAGIASDRIAEAARRVRDAGAEEAERQNLGGAHSGSSSSPSGSMPGGTASGSQPSSGSQPGSGSKPGSGSHPSDV